MVEGQHATGDLAYHIPELNSSVAGDDDGEAAGEAAGDESGDLGDPSKSPSPEDEELIDWPPFVS